ncbi:unnamed protein product [Phytomonas sp. EM1]|nr:unnamed protein product [Phytomonas sp. EM1]|eukprot:CCW65853.1 unnamed protein product [Phytomonas sp. isolate EM1]
MPKFFKEYKALISILQSESDTLASILQNGRRQKVYLKHIFVRRADRLVKSIRRSLVPSLLRDSALGNDHNPRLTAALHRAHRCCKMAAEAATNELAAGRIDTAALAMALLGCVARLGCALGRVLLLVQGRDHCVSLWGADYVSRLENLVQPSSSRKQPRDRANPNDGIVSAKKVRLENSNPTFGNVIDSLI